MSLKSKRIGSYVLAFIIIVILIFSLGSVCQTIYEAATGNKVTLWSTVLFLGMCYGLVSATYVYARFIRISKQAIPFIGINLPNWFFDEKFLNEIKVSDNQLLAENEALNTTVSDLESFSNQIMDELRMKERDLLLESHISDIYIRHHKNASRLVRSLLQLVNEGKPNWKWEFCNNLLDECNTVLLKDSADKSSSIFFINSKQELEMYVYNRIEFSSSRKRRFKYEEGFAGHVWSYGETVLINNIKDSSFFKGEFAPRHEYGSILGIPIKVDEAVVGVLKSKVKMSMALHMTMNVLLSFMLICVR